MSELVVLGAWDVPPIHAHVWFSDDAIGHFEKLTGVRMISFTWMKDGLHHQAFFKDSADKLKNITNEDSEKKIIRDYYEQARLAENFLQGDTDLKELEKFISDINQQFSKTTMPAWYAALLDLWYPLPEQEKQRKEQFGELRNHCGRLHERFKQKMKEVYGNAAQILHTEYDTIKVNFPENITCALQGSALRNVNSKMVVTTNLFGRYGLFDGDKANELKAQYWKAQEKQSKGLVACTGVARGKVKIVLSEREFSKFNKGDVLVCFQTMINYVPIMEKAAAIVTEFGGLTSHAVIVSREMKKPCIVGISDVTEKFQDGDFIEVDAQKGFVRKVDG